MIKSLRMYLYTFYYRHWAITSAGGQLFPYGIIHPVVSASALACIWFIGYIYYGNLQFLNNVIINKN
jgi:hypothetical protein